MTRREMTQRICGLEKKVRHGALSLTGLYRRVERLERLAPPSRAWYDDPRPIFDPCCPYLNRCTACPYRSRITWGDNSTGTYSADSNDAQWSYSYGRDLNSSDAG